MRKTSLAFGNLPTQFMMAGISRNFETASRILSLQEFDVNAGAGDWPIIFSLVDSRSYGIVKLVSENNRTNLYIKNRFDETPDQYADDLGLSVIAGIWRSAQHSRSSLSE